MRLVKARIDKYRSISEPVTFEVESEKTIFVGPNEAGKTAVLQALQQLNPPPDCRKLDPLRDYPRSQYNDISTKKVAPSQVVVVEGEFELDDDDKAAISEEFRSSAYIRGRKLDNTSFHRLRGAPDVPKYRDIKRDLARLQAHVASRVEQPVEGAKPSKAPPALEGVVGSWKDEIAIDGKAADELLGWLASVLSFVDETNPAEDDRHARLTLTCEYSARRKAALAELDKRVPTFVLFSNYFRVRPNIHLAHLAQRIESNLLDDDQYDYGNQCLLKLLGFTARELSELGKAPEPAANNPQAFQKYRDQLDQRHYQLNAASVRLTDGIREVWHPDSNRAEADRLRIVPDGQYLKVVVEDDLGVDIELDQRSEGFQWLVSFFVVFFAEAEGKHNNAILLLDEPGLSLHGLKQREFRATISRLANKNQTLYTTHSPFLVGPDELDIVRVVEMQDRRLGTRVHSDVVSEDPAALLPLQEALGYDLAQSLFAHERNLVLEGLTDYWYVDSISALLREANLADLEQAISMIPAQSAGKVVYFATILHAHKLKVAALLDSDAAGEQAAKQDILVHKLGNKAILRTRDVYIGQVTTPEIEDLLRNTIVKVAKGSLGWDVENVAAAQEARPILDIFSSEIPGFSKYRLAKAFLRWTRDHDATDLELAERDAWVRLVGLINKALK